jgi:hypothetical protein
VETKQGIRSGLDWVDTVEKNLLELPG